MKKITVSLLCICLSMSALAQQPDSTAESAFIAAAQENILIAVTLADELNMLERAVTYGSPDFDKTKIAYKGLVRFFPIHDESGSYKVVFWYADPNPVVCAVGVVNFERPGAIITYKEREPTPDELQMCHWTTRTLQDIASDSSYTFLPNTYLVLIPFKTLAGGRVYTYQRSKEFTTCLFGNDYMYKFDKTDSLILKVKLHTQPDKCCVEQVQTDDKNPRTVYHYHDYEDMKGFPVPDLASVMYYSNIHGWDNLVLINTRDIFSINLSTLQVTVYTHEEYKKEGLKLPAPAAGWNL